jgi:hypothetical protein
MFRGKLIRPNEVEEHSIRRLFRFALAAIRRQPWCFTHNGSARAILPPPQFRPELELCSLASYLSCMALKPKTTVPLKLVQEWPLTPAATLGSSVRAKGILLEARARMPFAARKFLDVETGTLALRIPEGDDAASLALAAIVTKTLEDIEALPVIPREVEDILTISQAERHRWLKDGRLKSAGTRTVKLRGRAKAVTFHVFDPRHIEDALDRDLPSLWREEDAQAAAENRRRAAGKAARTRAGKKNQFANDAQRADPIELPLKGWDAFELDGLLR